MHRTASEMPPDRRASTNGRAFGRALAVVGLCWSIGLGAWTTPAEARRSVEVPSSLASIPVAELPPQGREVLAAIRAGGPFASPRDGVVFGNREGLLPPERRGYYAEYTVPTPGAHNRGARRIIAGRGTTGDFRNSNEYYYTNDHYQSFRRIVQ